MNAAMELNERGWSMRSSLTYAGATRTAWYYKKRPRHIGSDPAAVLLVRKIGVKRPTYGTRRMAAQIRRQTGTPTNRKKMQKIYREMGWITPKKTKNEIIGAGKKNRFKPAAPNQLWQTDITYVWCGIDGWCYCFNVVDVFTRRWVAYVFSTEATAKIAVESLTKAISTLPVKERAGLRVRSDNGTQYASREFKKSMEVLGIRHEYIWHNTPQQNGHVESFHKTLKKEYVWPHDFAMFQDAEVILAAAFTDYNGDRIHSALGYLTPDEFIQKILKEVQK